MKKLLYIFFAVALFVSCSDDDDKNSIEYLDNNLIEGSWYNIQATDSTVYTFQKMQQQEKLLKNILGKLQMNVNTDHTK